MGGQAKMLISPNLKMLKFKIFRGYVPGPL